jgi:hypothetical protein
MPHLALCWMGHFCVLPCYVQTTPSPSSAKIAQGHIRRGAFNFMFQRIFIGYNTISPLCLAIFCALDKEGRGVGHFLKRVRGGQNKTQFLPCYVLTTPNPPRPKTRKAISGGEFATSQLNQVKTVIFEEFAGWSINKTPRQVLKPSGVHII